MTQAESVLALSAALAAALAALLLAEAMASRPGIWAAKPVASTLFVAIAWVAGAPESPFGQLILLGLALSWLGDVLLIPKHQLCFVAGLGSFLLAHLAYAAAFLLQTVALAPLVVGAIGMLGVAGSVLRWLWPHLQAPMRLPVVAYVLAISVMVILASSTVASIGAVLLTGAILFAASDIFVARERFVTSSVANRFIGLPLYYGAQLVFALSVQTGV